MELLNPAEQASEQALAEMFAAINQNRSFRLEAGAGAGKTYSLIEALKYLIKNKAKQLLKRNQRIACITFTNVAKNEINARIDNHPAVFSETIHAFSWNLLKGFQKEMISYIPDLNERWKERIDEIGGLTNQKVSYDLGYPKVTEEEVTLHHNDVIQLMCHFLTHKKFQLLLISLYPILLIDEYQDTNAKLAAHIIDNLIENNSHILIGWFGDHWQKIYGTASCGLIKSDKIIVIGKNANFRSKANIVEVLNKMRPELPQQPKDPDSEGQINIYHTNNWKGERRTGSHWLGDLPAEIAHRYLEQIVDLLKNEGWEFTPSQTKILMLTNNILAEEQYYSSIASIFQDSDDYLKKNNPYIEFFIDVIEAAVENYEQKKYGAMSEMLGSYAPIFRTIEDKIKWKNDFDKLIELREEGTIGDVINHLSVTRHPRLSHKLEEREHKFIELSKLEEIPEEEQRFYDIINSLKNIKYKEIIALSGYINDKTPFSTKHGVKGAQFENVLIICGRGWNQYNWSQMLEWVCDGIPKGKEETFERSRNLFYVACSRPKRRLAVLFTQILSPAALNTIESWFGKENITELD